MIKIAITGPESSGKTELSVWLASKLQGTFLIPEYAREYLEAKPIGYTYTSNEIVLCAEQTHEQIERALDTSTAVLICDTDFYVLDIWNQVVFDQKNERINELKKQHPFDVYLLCAPDIPWSYDPLRVDEYNRDGLFVMYEEALKKDNANYFIVKGTDEERYENTLAELLQLFPTLRLKD